MSEFETLNQSEQTEVLKYLETTGSDDIQQAIQTLKRFNMSAERAISHRFNNVHQQETVEPMTYNRQQQQQLIRYNSYLKDIYIERSSIWFIVKYYSYALLGIAKGLTQCVMPRCARRTIFYSKFQKLYKDLSKVSFHARGFDDAFRKATYDQKCVAIIVSPVHQSREIVQFITSRNQVTKQLSSRIITIGVIINSEQYRKLKIQIAAPSIVFAYKTIFGQIKVLQSCGIAQTNEDTLKQAITTYRNNKRHEKNIVIRYKNRILSMHADGQQYMEQQIPDSGSYEHDRLLVTQQKEQYQQAAKVRKQSIQKQQQQRVRKESIAQQRKIRKLSLPEQPVQGDIVLLNFRCPNGTKIQRKFAKQDKIQMIYEWVQTNEDIEFQQQPQRKFQLLVGYPPQPLSEKKDKKIKQQMQDQRQVILIREL